MEYQWDEDKREANLIKHGVDFTDANHFDWPRAMTITDCRQQYGELRHISYAPINNRLFVMVWTPRGSITRIIGLRKANPREEKRYANNKT